MESYMSIMRVTWEIDIDADSPLEAANMALKIQRDPMSIATCFIVNDGQKTVYIDVGDKE